MTRGRHLRFQVLGALTLAIGALPWSFAASLGDPVQLAGAYFSWAAALYLYAAGGAAGAALTLSPGDAMRPGWTFLATSYVVLIPAGLWYGPRGLGLYESTNRSPAVLVTAGLASGAMAVTAFLLLSRAWRLSGLDVTSRASRVVTRIVALAVALALAGPDLVERFPDALRGDVLAVGDVVTDVLDGAVFVVAVPILRAALLLGGGLAAWPWIFLTSSLFAWLGYDAVAAYGDVAGLAPRTIRVAEETFRALGAAFTFAAGVAQRWMLTERLPRSPATDGRGDGAPGRP